MVLNHNEVYDIFRAMRTNKIVASYIGIFDRNILVSLGKNLKERLVEDLTQAKRFFKIFIELASNISNYSHERQNDNGIGTLIIQETEDKLKISAGNLIDEESKNFLEEKIELINSLDRNGLRALKRKLLGQPSKTNNGNIGLVQMALISHHKIEYKFVNLEKNNFFYILTITIDKTFSKIQ